jgi:tryptophan-rich sensory protein
VSLRQVLVFIGFLAVSFVPALIGASFKPGPWYVTLVKPDWTPPNYLFAPVWTILYLTIAMGGWLIYQTANLEKLKRAFTFYFLQLILNGLWSWLFFGLHRPGLALVDISALWISIIATILTMSAIRLGAGLLLVPYLFWVSFATALNFSIWRLNP